MPYTEAECLHALQRVADEIGHTPTVAEYEVAKAESDPSAGSIQNYCGGWNAAKQEVGLETCGKGRKRTEQYTEAECLEALQRVADTLEKSPSVGEYDVHRRSDEPSSATIGEYCGGWNAAKREVGLDVLNGPSYTDAECINALTRAAKQCDKPLTIMRYEAVRADTDPSGGGIATRFDGWNAAKQQAGLSVRSSQDTASRDDGDRKLAFGQTTREAQMLTQAIEAIQRVAAAVDSELMKDDYRQRRHQDEPSVHQLRRIGVSWEEACAMAGVQFPPNPDSDVQRECLEALQAVIAVRDSVPTPDEYDAARDDTDPSSWMVRLQLAGWDAACTLASGRR